MLISVFSLLVIISPTFNPSGDSIYDQSPSLYLINARLEERFGSYWIESTIPSTPNLDLLKSIN